MSKKKLRKCFRKLKNAKKNKKVLLGAILLFVLFLSEQNLSRNTTLDEIIFCKSQTFEMTNYTKIIFFQLLEFILAWEQNHIIV